MPMLNFGFGGLCKAVTQFSSYSTIDTFKTLFMTCNCYKLLLPGKRQDKHGDCRGSVVILETSWGRWMLKDIFF